MFQKRAKIFNVTLFQYDLFQVISPDAKMYYCELIGKRANLLQFRGIKVEGEKLVGYLMPVMSIPDIIRRIDNNWQYKIVARNKQKLEFPIDIIRT